MKSYVPFIAAALAVATFAPSGAFATAKTSAPAAKKTAVKTMACPACSMPMPSIKTKATPVAVKTAKGTFYCCTACAAGKAHMKATSAHTKTTASHAKMSGMKM